MLEDLSNLLVFYASYTGGIDVEISLSKGEKNSEMLKDLFKLIKIKIDKKEFSDAQAEEFLHKYSEILNNPELNKGAMPEDIEEDETLDEKYYIINYDEEPFIPQQHYFNSFYMVDQIMFDKDEADQVLQGQELGEGEEEEEEEGMEYH